MPLIVKQFHSVEVSHDEINNIVLWHHRRFSIFLPVSEANLPLLANWQTMDEIQQLEKLSLVNKIVSELNNHVGLNDKAVGKWTLLHVIVMAT